MSYILVWSGRVSRTWIPDRSGRHYSLIPGCRLDCSPSVVCPPPLTSANILFVRPKYQIPSTPLNWKPWMTVHCNFSLSRYQRPHETTVLISVVSPSAWPGSFITEVVCLASQLDVVLYCASKSINLSCIFHAIVPYLAFKTCNLSYIFHAIVLYLALKTGNMSYISKICPIL